MIARAGGVLEGVRLSNQTQPNCVFPNTATEESPAITRRIIRESTVHDAIFKFLAIAGTSSIQKHIFTEVFCSLLDQPSILLDSS